MRETKSIIPSFAFYDRTGIQKYLEKQAEEGWLLESATNYRWKFRRMEPRKLTFAVVYFPEADLYDPAPGEEELTFREFCAHGGWNLAGSVAQMQIFWSGRENPTPIETDPILEIENIHKSMKKSSLPGYWCLVLAGILNLIAQGIGMNAGLVRYLSSGMNLAALGAWLILLPICIYRLVSYGIWRRRAIAVAEQDGSFLETKASTRIENIGSLIVLVGYAAVLVSMKDTLIAPVMVLTMAAVFAVHGLMELLRRWMKKEGYEAARAKKITMVTSVCLVLAVVLVLVPALTKNIMSHQGAESKPGAPLNIWELREEQEENFGSLMMYDQESVLLEYKDAYQHPQGNSRTPHLEYDYVRVKWLPLYELCLNEVMEIPAHMAGSKWYRIDAAPWGAERAWQLYDGEEYRQWYVLCYGDVILEMVIDWEITQEQMDYLNNLLNSRTKIRK